MLFIGTRLWAAGLTLDYQVSETTGELFLLVGAEQHILEDEASQEDGTVVMMRMQEATQEATRTAKAPPWKEAKRTTKATRRRTLS